MRGRLGDGAGYRWRLELIHGPAWTPLRHLARPDLPRLREQAWLCHPQHAGSILEAAEALDAVLRMAGTDAPGSQRSRLTLVGARTETEDPLARRFDTAMNTLFRTRRTLFPIFRV